MSSNWQDKIREYCYRYNIPLEYLSDTLYEPKVVPMVRGKAFEFTVMLALQNILPNEIWDVEKKPMNAQQGFHDVDVVVRHKSTGKAIRIECKLAAKGSFQTNQKGNSIIKVKCMRSRTLGESMVKQLAPKFNISEKQLTVHNDQYLPGDFDVVVTSIGNAFYETGDDGFFDWMPSKDAAVFLRFLSESKENNGLKDFAFNRMYIATAQTLSIDIKNEIRCTRRKCRTKTKCGFVPNYPIIKFQRETKTPELPWIPIELSVDLFKGFLKV